LSVPSLFFSVISVSFLFLVNPVHHMQYWPIPAGTAAEHQKKSPDFSGPGLSSLD